jgi:hypothetical protein
MLRCSSSNLEKNAAENYKKYLKPNTKNADTRIQGCVLNVFRNSVSNYGLSKLKKIASTQLSPKATKELLKTSRNNVDACLKNY